jgi:organic hydroperoxide reductase OsmC/OhrA
LSTALVGRGIPATPGKVVADVEADVERIDRLAVLSRVRLKYRLKVPPGKRQAAERAVAVHEQGCPISQSLRRGIAVEWSSDIEEEA